MRCGTLASSVSTARRGAAQLVSIRSDARPLERCDAAPLPDNPATLFGVEPARSAGLDRRPPRHRVRGAVCSPPAERNRVTRIHGHPQVARNPDLAPLIEDTPPTIRTATVLRSSFRLHWTGIACVEHRGTIAAIRAAGGRQSRAPAASPRRPEPNTTATDVRPPVLHSVCPCLAIVLDHGIRRAQYGGVRR